MELHVGVDILSELMGHEECLEEGVEVARGTLVDESLIGH